MALIGNFYASQAAQQQEAKLQECSNMLNQIDSEKGSWWARNFDGNAINQLVDQYNSMCAGTTTNYAGAAQ